MVGARLLRALLLGALETCRHKDCYRGESGVWSLEEEPLELDDPIRWRRPVQRWRGEMAVDGGRGQDPLTGSKAEARSGRVSVLRRVRWNGTCQRTVDQDLLTTLALGRGCGGSGMRCLPAAGATLRRGCALRRRERHGREAEELDVSTRTNAMNLRDAGAQHQGGSEPGASDSEGLTERMHQSYRMPVRALWST